MLVQLQGREVWYLQLNEAVSRRLVELMQERGMTQYQLYMKSGVPKSTIGNLVNCAYPSMKLRIIHELCQGLEKKDEICSGVISLKESTPTLCRWLVMRFSVRS